VVAALQQALSAQHFKALVVAVGGAAAGVDLAQAAFLGANSHRRAVHIAQGGNGRVGQHRAGGAEPGGFVAIGAQNPAKHIEVMDQHVAKDAARGLDVLGRRCARVAAGDDEHLGVADLACVHAGAGGVKRGVKAALKTQHAGHARSLHGGGAGLSAGDGQIHRLFAKNMLAGGGGAGDQIAVGVGGRADGHYVYGFVGKHFFNTYSLRAVFLRQLIGVLRHGVAHVFKLDAGQRSKVGSVNAANAARAKNCNVLHEVSE
jgi:hypothetical protein